MYTPYSDYINVTIVSFAAPYAAPKLCIAQAQRHNERMFVGWNVFIF